MFRLSALLSTSVCPVSIARAGESLENILVPVFFPTYRYFFLERVLTYIWSLVLTYYLVFDGAPRPSQEV